MINYTNVNALTKGRGRSYGFFDSAKKNGTGLSPEEHDRRLALREEAYEMRRQRGQARRVEDRQFASDQAFKDRRREASVKISEDITRMRALHPVKLELDRDTHAQELTKKADFHRQSMDFDRDKSAARLQATQATDAHKLQHEVRRTRTMHSVKSGLADDTHAQRLGHRADTQRQELGHRQEAHTQRLGHFEEQVAAGMRRRVTQPSSQPVSVKAPKAVRGPAEPAQPISVPHPSPRAMPRPQADTPRRQATQSTPQSAQQPSTETFTPHQTSRLDEAVSDIKTATRKSRSSHDPRPSTVQPAAPRSATPAPTRKPVSPSTAPTPTSSKPSGSPLPQASTGIKLPGSEMFEHVSGRFSWDKRTVKEKLKTQLPGERIETRDESSARIKRRQALKTP